MTIVDEIKAITRDWRIAERKELEAVVKEEPPYISEYKKALEEREKSLVQECYSKR